jgi:tRNA threonylcarbamoyladenosine biosynthesis protein TsaE
MEFLTRSPEETEAIARELVEDLNFLKGRPGTALIVGLSGDLGAGKTAFVKGIGKALRVPHEITSPTFVIQKIYPTEHPHFSRLVHIDAYRLEEPSELVALNWHETATDPKNLIFVEWPERVEPVIPVRALRLNFEMVDQDTRRIYTEEDLQ